MAIEQTAAVLRDKPVDEDLLARARNPELEKADHQLRDNGFWLAALSKAQSEPERLDRIRKKKEVLQSITAADLQKLAKEYLKPETRQNAEIVSSKVASAAASGAPQAAK